MCGIGLIADARGRESHDLIERGLAALCRLSHRGASAETASIDGAGILSQIPWTLFARELPARLRAADNTRMLGMFFFPSDSRASLQPIIERALREDGWGWIRWRPVPVRSDALTAEMRSSRPEISQVIGVADGQMPQADARLYRARLRIRREAARLGFDGFSVVSLSTATVVYKGLVTPPDLPQFFPDLRDPRFASALAIVHLRFSTNTLPQWGLAQPFQAIAHNGEINTIAGNRLWMRARQRDAACVPLLAGESLVSETGSDSQSLDDAVELLRHSGFSLPHALSRLIPPAWERNPDLSPEVTAFYAYQSCFSEPWDGPAAIAFTDGRLTGAVLDRNGFRPIRYVRTADNLLLLGSEAGIFDVAEREGVCRGRLGPGEMIAVDTGSGSFHGTAAIREALARQRPYGQMLRRMLATLEVEEKDDEGATPVAAHGALDGSVRRRLQKVFAYTQEEVDLVLRVMAERGEEPIGSMGDDAPPAVLSAVSRVLPDWFRQRFAQVTNPPMDPLREACVTSLGALLGPRGNYLNEAAPQPRLVSLPSPVLDAARFRAIAALSDWAPATIPLLFPATGGDAALEEALERLVETAADAVRKGAALIILTDRGVDESHAPMPPLLGAAAVHHDLIARGCRLRADLVVETGEARDPHQIATLLAYGASAVFPYLAYETVADLAAPADARENVARYRRALEQGLLKIFSKMGVSTLGGYRGGQLFEIFGLDAAVVNRYFPGTPSPLGGSTIRDLARQSLDRHADAFSGRSAHLGYPGFHTYRRDGEYHANNPAVVRQLHRTAASESREAYALFQRMVTERPPTAVRDLLEFRAGQAVPLAEVEPAERICRRFFASAMSVGALSPEAHRAIAIAMNRIGGRSNSGEGGEEPERFERRPGEEWSGSATKQVASARFGVTPGYLVSAEELQIKIAQGSKPGEGGQLPAIKVVDYIARLRHTQPGITLISPPVHHDIYSIEDLAQLIFDLKRLHPEARINVKLVAQTGVGIVAAGVAKAGAGAILISGHDGGTGASPRASIKHAGMPWEVGLAEAQQVLAGHGLRRRVALQTDGGLKTGRDVAIAAALGADEFGFGTAALVAIGCVMARQCHLNTCPAGIATQRPDLRRRFAGTPDMLVAYFRLLAEDVRGILASCGLRRLDDLVGRADLLAPRASVAAGRLDIAPLLVRAQPAEPPAAPSGSAPPADATETLDAIGPDRPLEFTGTVRNTDRAIGARLAGAIAARFGDAGLPPGSVRMRLTGSAGQSFGAFLVPGVSLFLAGEANDYVGKSMHGGEIVIRPATIGGRDPAVLVGNTALYGATGGRVFIAGSAGERFAVRNSGALAVVEGIGDHGCEYMTGGTVIVLGRTGRNFAAGMTGGLAFVYDAEGRFPTRVNRAMADALPLDETEWDDLAALIAMHYDLTRSETARRLLRRGVRAHRAFWKVVPLFSYGPQAARDPAGDRGDRVVHGRGRAASPLAVGGQPSDSAARGRVQRAAVPAVRTPDPDHGDRRGAASAQPPSLR
jgi:glutamate synthase domain-containing protein 2/glutamate synthase domain-containing protein 1/glutamate synthase domain-containing protein 3